MQSDTEAELGRLFEKCQKATSMKTFLAEMGHQQPPKLVATENTATSSIVNGTAKPKIFQAIDMRFYWVRDRIRQNHFHIFQEEGKKKHSRLCHKTPPNLAPQKNQTKRCKTNTKRHRKLKRPANWDRKRVCQNYQSRGNLETGHPLQGIQYTILLNLYNTRMGIQELVPKRIRIQWQRGLTVPT